MKTRREELIELIFANDEELYTYIGQIASWSELKEIIDNRIKLEIELHENLK